MHINWIKNNGLKKKKETHRKSFFSNVLGNDGATETKATSDDHADWDVVDIKEQGEDKRDNEEHCHLADESGQGEHFLVNSFDSVGFSFSDLAGNPSRRILNDGDYDTPGRNAD